VIAIPLPDKAGRKAILKIHSKKMTLIDVDLDRIVESTENATGADLQAVCREAGMMAVRREAAGVSQDDFEKAVRKVKAEVVTDLRMYT
jgi:proteasome regulatory subunit